MKPFVYCLTASMTVPMAACSGMGDSADQIGQSLAPVEVGGEREVDPPDPVPRHTVYGSAHGTLTTLTYDLQNESYLASWSDRRERFPSESVTQSDPTYVARIGRDGTLRDPTGIRLLSPTELPPGTIASLPRVNDGVCNDAGLCLLVGEGWNELQAFLVEDGQLVDETPLLISDHGRSPVWVTWDGEAFRVAWQGVSPYFTYLTRITVDGQVEAPVQVTDVIADPTGLACEGDRCLVFYNHIDDSRFRRRARLVDLDAPVGDELALDGGGPAWASRPCWDGGQYWVSFFGPAGVGVHRVSADGALIDQEGIQVAAIGNGDPDDRDVSLACDDSRVMLSWTYPAVGGPGSHRSYVARVALDGTVLDPGGVEIAATQPVTGGGPLACHAGQCLATWQRSIGFSRTVRATRLDGVTPLEPDGIEIINAPPGQVNAASTYAGGLYMTAWIDSRASEANPFLRPIRASLYTPSLDDLLPIEIDPGDMRQESCDPFFPPEPAPAVAASASSFLASWTSFCNAVGPRIQVTAQVVDREGNGMAPALRLDPVAVHSTTISAAASSGDAFLALWQRDEVGGASSVQARRLDATGSPLDPAPFPVAASGKEVVAAFDGTSYVAVWQQLKADRTEDLHAARISPDGIVLDSPSIPIATDLKREGGQSIACGGGVCLVVWRRGLTANKSGVRALRLTPDGIVLDPEGFEVSPVVKPVATAVTFTGSSFVVAWREGDGEIRGAQVSLDGAVVGPRGFLISPPGEVADNPSLVSNGIDQVLALYDRLDMSPEYRIRRVRARAIGELEPPTFARPTGATDGAAD